MPTLRSKATLSCMIIALMVSSSPYHSEAVTVTAEIVEEWARLLGEQIEELFNGTTKATEIQTMYEAHGEPEIFDPRRELKRVKHTIGAYMKRRSKVAWDAKLSLQSRTMDNFSEEEVNNPLSKNFIRFMSAKTESDAAYVHSQASSPEMTEANGTTYLKLIPNANYYGIATSSISSAVHIPTPIYQRNRDVLLKIKWSDIDRFYRSNREETRDLSFQMFCSESGFLRYFPAAAWIWDNKHDQLDLFDCRSTDWYINGATRSKNVLVMLDLSGSMLGQRFEIAKQAVEAIFETLSDNDFFNIMPFSKATTFLDECAEGAGLLQATIHNKKLLRSELNAVNSEGKAEYEKALTKAFQTLMKIRNYTGSGENFGCDDVIILITDGAPGYYSEIFQLYNPKKTIRFFSFLIGEEAIEVDQVKWMACSNKGFMAHISNLADVNEKVQEFTKVMSRPLGRYASKIKEGDAIWSGVYKERLLTTSQETSKRKSRIKRVDARSEMFVTTVSYPVSVNDTFMGVVGVSVPVTELMQLAYSSNLQPRSYMFMLDNNGYVMFHPQLRPIDPETLQTKPNYNSVDILELEVSQNQELMRRSLLECGNTEAQTLNILFATEDLDRVYRQTNTYYVECMKESLFTIGMAVAKGEEKRLKPKKLIEYREVDRSWYEGTNWRIHPQWRYCLVNDTDSAISAEEAFSVYLQQMRETGELPFLCASRKVLVHRVLFDMKALSGLTDLWRMNRHKILKNGVQLVFFATPSGLIKFWDELPPGMLRMNPNPLEPTIAPVKNATAALLQQRYIHFIKEQNQRSVEDRYFRRSIRVRNRIVVDINKKTKLWYNKKKESAYGNNESMALLMTATKALFVHGTAVGVVGMEFMADTLVRTMAKIGCSPADLRNWCFLLDEHAYVVYSSNNNTRYDNLFTTNSPDRNHNILGQWFGEVNRITERTMSLLIKNNFYTETKYVDYQATCKHDHTRRMLIGSASRCVSSVVKMIVWMVVRLWRFLWNFSAFSTITSLLQPISAYTATFHGGEERFSCDMSATFYLANWGEEGWSGRRQPQSAALISSGLSERPCRHNSAKCAVKMYASWVRGTNLLLVVISQTNAITTGSCYDKTQCPLSAEFQHSFSEVYNASGKQIAINLELSDPLSENPEFDHRCRHIRSKHRKIPSKCIPSDYDESDLPCSNCFLSLKRQWLYSLFCFPVLYLYQHLIF